MVVTDNSTGLAVQLILSVPNWFICEIAALAAGTIVTVEIELALLVQPEFGLVAITL